MPGIRGQKQELSDNYTAAVFVYYIAGNKEIMDVHDTKSMQNVFRERRQA